MNGHKKRTLHSSIRMNKNSIVILETFYGTQKALIDDDQRMLCYEVNL